LRQYIWRTGKIKEWAFRFNETSRKITFENSAKGIISDFEKTHKSAKLSQF
jgi:hypothetical protein